MNKNKMSRKENITVIKKIIRYAGDYKLLLLLSVLLSFGSAALALVIPVFTGDCIDCIAGRGNVDFDRLFSRMMMIGVFALSITVLQWLLNLCNNKMTYCIIRDIRRDAFERVEHLPLSYIDAHPHGDMVSRIIADAEVFGDGLLVGLTQFFTSVVTIIGTLIFMVLVNPYIALLVFVLTPLSLFAAAFIAGKTHSLFTKQSVIRGEQTSFIDEMVGNEKIIRAFGREEESIEEFDEINNRLGDISLKAVFYSSTVNPTTRFINSLVYASVALLGGFFVITGGITVGQLTCLLSYANQHTKPFNEISNVITELENALACAARIFDLIETETEVPDGDDAVVMKDASGHVDIENMSFSYSKDKKLITDFNLTIDKGMKVAIVGPTGCGKTTLINLLMRFYDVDSGSIKLDGVDIRDMTRESLRENYGMVLQETWLFHGTIFENIAMQKKDATMEEVVDAAKRAHAHSFISRLPEGYNTYIGDDLGGLSEGQRQLLCIARVMMALPPVLILDEATSSIDTRTEIKIQSAFKTMTAGRSSFVIAHRLSTIKHSDIILVMRDGNIIEKGNHETLMAMKGFYNELYTSQFALNQSERS